MRRGKERPTDRFSFFWIRFFSPELSCLSHPGRNKFKLGKRKGGRELTKRAGGWRTLKRTRKGGLRSQSASR